MNLKYFFSRIFDFNTKKGYIAVVVLFCIVTLGLYFSFAAFTTSSEKKGALNIKVGDLYSSMESKSLDSNNEIEVGRNSTEEFVITIKNINQVGAKFNLYYSTAADSDSYDLFYLQEGDIAPGPEGVVLAPNEERQIKVRIVNKTYGTVQIRFGSNVGLSGQSLLLPENTFALTELPINHLKARSTVNPMESYYYYSYDIYTVTFHDKINIPTDGSVAAQWDISADNSGEVMAYIVSVGPGKYDLYIEANGKITAPDNCGSLFANFRDLKEIKNIYLLNTSYVTNMSSMFSNCYNLTNLDLSSFSTQRVEDMSNMFSSSGIAILDVSNFDTSNVKNMAFMFAYSQSFVSLDLTSFDTHNITSMQDMFYRCYSLSEVLVKTGKWVEAADSSGMFDATGMNAVTYT